MIQIVGLQEQNGSNDCIREFNPGVPPVVGPSGIPAEAKAYEVGRAVVGLNSADVTVAINADWSGLSSADQLARSLKCNNGGAPAPSLGTFTTLASMTNTRTDFATTYDIRSGSPKIHVMGGSPTTFGETYDIMTNTWSFQGGSISPVGLAGSVLLPYPVPSTGPTPGLIRLGGSVSNSTQQIYTSGVWASPTPMAAAIVVGSSSPVTVPAQGATYLFGGPSGTAQVNKYTYSTGTLTYLGALSAGRNRASTTLLSTGKIIIAGGTTGTGAMPNCDLFDPSNNSITTCANLQTAVFDGVIVPGPNGDALLIGGTTGPSPSNVTSVVQFYSGTGNTWTTGPALPGPRTDARGVLLPDGRIFIMGGRDDMGAALSSTLFFSPGGPWTSGPNLAVARMAFGFERVPDGTIYVIGGKNTGGTSLNTIEHWVP
jgi:hypothetical protein